MADGTIDRPALLIVESNQTLLDRMARHFSAKGYAVTAVHHPRRALASAMQRQYAQAVIGQTLPEFDGIRLAEKLKRQLGDMRLILLAEVDDAALRHEALEAGVDVVLASPGRLSELESLLSADHLEAAAC
jgi:two-component system response regulator PfeR